MTTLEKLCDGLINDWKTGSYTKAYNDYDALLNGREMKEIFIEQARKQADVVEEADVMYMAEQLEEWIDEGIANLQ
jgi:hypothetical protein